MCSLTLMMPSMKHSQETHSVKLSTIPLFCSDRLKTSWQAHRKLSYGFFSEWLMYWWKKSTVHHCNWRSSKKRKTWRGRIKTCRRITRFDKGWIRRLGTEHTRHAYQCLSQRLLFNSSSERMKFKILDLTGIAVVARWVQHAWYW
jgi:hypothetical protein